MSKPNIEITIPANATEVTLLTADKYCDGNIVVKKEKSFRVVSGSINFAEDASNLTITGLPSNVQTLELRPNSDVGEAEYSGGKWTRYPINYFCYTAATDKEGRYNNTPNTWCQFKVTATSNGSVVTTMRGAATQIGVYDREAGTLSLTINTDDTGPLVFAGGFTYNWTAYCWDD